MHIYHIDGPLCLEYEVLDGITKWAPGIFQSIRRVLDHFVSGLIILAHIGNPSWLH